MKTKKELYLHLAENCKIYLPNYQLDLAFDMLENRQKKSVFSVLYKIESDARFTKCKNALMGAYTIENKHIEWAASASKAVIQLDKETGEEVGRHDSLYAAAVAVGKSKNFSGNISDVCNNKAKSSCGFKWKWA